MTTKDKLIHKSKKMDRINPYDLLSTLLQQLYWCSEEVKKTGKISQDDLGKILVINNVFLTHYGMTWEETSKLFVEYGLEQSMIEKEDKP